MKIEKTTILAFVAITFIPCLFTKATTNLIVNGSFETGTDPGSWLRLDSGSTAIDDWIVTRSKIDYIGTYWAASHGDKSLDLDGGPRESGGIKQTFSTVLNKLYSVTFDMAGNPTGPPTTKLMRVEAAGDSNDFSFDMTVGNHTLGDMGWVKCFWQFTATGTETTLEFYSLDETGDFGPALDNVVVVPEPATICLLGLGALSLLRRKRSA
jgi:choice-of-anchor C domain-containing protein